MATLAYLAICKKQIMTIKMEDLIFTEKGKLKWRGDFTTLQQFLDKAFNIKGNWTTASGAKTLKIDKATIRWYSQNESLTIGGTDAENKKKSRCCVMRCRDNTIFFNFIF
jgi:hypothetical protein